MDIYTDGSCLGNPGPGGWAWVTSDMAVYRSSYDSNTTNNRMELTAVIDALETFPECSRIFTDSSYIVDCLKNKWHVKWVSNGWKASRNKPVKNRDLWEKLLALVAQGNVEFVWVRGHDGNKLNEYADLLATVASATQTSACSSVD